MADVYIIYAKENRATALKVRDYLSASWSVWLDDFIVGDFNVAIKESIQQAKCVVALYSSFASKPAVTGELSLAEKYQKKIIPLLLDDSDPPYPYGHLSSVDFRSWPGAIDHPTFQLLQKKIGLVVAPRAKPARLAATAGGALALPNVFMSVSSHETQFDPVDALSALRIHATSSILVSAYDLIHSQSRDAMVEEIQTYRDNGGFVLIDSGNYEAHRLNDTRWKPAHLKKVLLNTPHDWAFCFDNMKPSDKFDVAVRQVVRAVERDAKHTSAPMLPIIHIKQNEAGLARLPRIVRAISEQLRPPIIAIPERELGAGLAQRALTVRQIRDELDKLPYYQSIHLLGTGNPWSIAVLAAAGADTFDGLEWCRFAVDPSSERLHHFQHFDFFRAKRLRTDLMDVVDADEDIGYAGKVAFHNLEYYGEFNRLMREMYSTGDTESFALGVTGLKSVELRKLFPGIFL
ncbi:queuine/archaeosine tRNA-ribosyltransferase [Pseudomonas sp. GM49]|uniref:toll/interleukin-1 receptor domain-containing protein n=1 Tax=Pseudomonas sp. GM49 TaxID=1144331 RepID=UPI00027081D0|nr:toll/interleukin-1 receptor domain-containing protein [Pseudomonas sp. GM49]EJM69338.1 queuine/archaeosine tRNA-ribosyltransferase [Pseudomonas sp. GM49]